MVEELERQLEQARERIALLENQAREAELELTRLRLFWKRVRQFSRWVPADDEGRYAPTSKDRALAQLVQSFEVEEKDRCTIDH